MVRLFGRFAAMAALAWLACVAVGTPRAFAAADEVENPAYTAWSKFPVGSSQTLASTMQAGGMNVVVDTVSKLAEKTDTQVVIEITATMEFGGQRRQMPAQRQTIPAKSKKEDVKPLPDEKVEAAGEQFTCKVYQMKQTQGGETVDAKAWINDKVPGGVVKMDAKTSQGAISSVLKSYDVKK